MAEKQLALRGLSDGFVREVGQRFTTVREAALREGKRKLLGERSADGDKYR